MSQSFKKLYTNKKDFIAYKDQIYHKNKKERDIMEKKEIKKERRCIQVNYVTFPTVWRFKFQHGRNESFISI